MRVVTTMLLITGKTYFILSLQGKRLENIKQCAISSTISYSVINILAVDSNKFKLRLSECLLNNAKKTKKQFDKIVSIRTL